MECTQVIPCFDASQLDASLNEDQHVARLLVPKTSECEEAEYFLKNGENVIGRVSSSSSVCIQDLSVSRKHAVIECGGSRYFHVFDAGSANGTFLESKGSKSKLKPNIRYNLCSGDKLTFGTIVATFTKDLNSPRVIDDSDDSDTASESMLPLDDDLDEIIAGPGNRNKKQTILSDTEDEVSNAASCDSSSEIPSSQAAKTVEEVSPFKAPTTPAFRSSQFRPSQISSTVGSTSSGSNVKTSPEDSKSSSLQKSAEKSDDTVDDLETQMSLDDSIYDKETQRLNASIYDACTQKVSPKQSLTSGDKSSCSSRDPRKLSTDLCDMETQKPDESLYDKETQLPGFCEEPSASKNQKSHKNIYDMETQRPTIDFYDMPTQRPNEDIFSKETQKVNEDIYDKKTQRPGEDISIYDAETQKPDKSIYLQETQNVFSKRSKKGVGFSEDIYSKKTQKLSRNFYDAETQKPSEDIYNAETQKPSRNFFDADTQKPNEDIYDAETQKPSRNFYDAETQKPPSEDIFNVETQKPSRNFYDAETPKPSGDIYNSETQRLDRNIYTAETQKLNASHSSEASRQSKTSKPHDFEESIFDMPTQKSFMDDKLNKTEIGETNDEDDDAMTQIISSTPAINTVEARKSSLNALRSLGKDHLGSPIGSPSSASSKSLKSKASKSPSSNNVSSNASSLYAMDINSFNGGCDSGDEDLGKTSSTDKSKESKVPAKTSRNNSPQQKINTHKPEINEDDLDNAMTQKISVTAKSKSRINIRDRKQESPDERKSNLDTEMVGKQDSSSTKNPDLVKKTPLYTTELLEMSTQILDSTDGPSRNKGVADSGKFKSNLKKVIKDEAMDDLMTQKLPGRSDELDRMNFSKKSNHTNSEMELSDMLTQKIETVDGVENIRKIVKPIPKQTSTRQVFGKSSFHDTAQLDDMLTQKIPCDEKSKDITSHSVLSMDVCQSQASNVGKSENADRRNVSKASSSFTPYRRERATKSPEVISSSDETDDEIGDLVKPPSSTKEVESAEHSPGDLEVEMLCKEIETSRGMNKKPDVKEKSKSPPASQSVLADEDISMSPKSSANSDPILPDRTSTFFKRIPDTSKSSTKRTEAGGLDVTKKDEDDARSSGTITPDDFAFDSVDTKKTTKVLVPKSEETTVSKKDTRGPTEPNDDTKSSGTITPDDFAFVDDPENKVDTKKITEVLVPKSKEATVSKKDTRRQIEPADETKSSGTGTPDDVETSSEKSIKKQMERSIDTKSSGTMTPDDLKFENDTAINSDGKKITKELVSKDEETTSKEDTEVKPIENPELRTGTSGLTKGDMRSKKSRVESQKVSAKNRAIADLDASEIKLPSGQTDDCSTENEKLKSSKKPAAEPATPASVQKATSRRTLKSSAGSSKERAEEHEKSESEEPAPTRARSTRAKDTSGKYKLMLKGVKTNETENDANNDKSRRGRSLAKKPSEPDQTPKKQSEPPSGKTQTKSNRNRTISNEKSNELPSTKASLPKPSSSKSRRDSETSQSNNDTSVTTHQKKSALRIESEVDSDSSDAVFKKKESVRGRSKKSQSMEENKSPEVQVETVLKKGTASSRLRRAQVIASDSEDDVSKNENTRPSRQSRAAVLKQKKDEDTTVASGSPAISKSKPPESKKAKGLETTSIDPEETLKTRTPSKRRATQVLDETKISKAEISDAPTPKKKLTATTDSETKTRTPSKRKANQAAKETETQKDESGTSDAPTPTKKFKSNAESFKAPAKAGKVEEDSGMRSSRRRKPSQSEPDDVPSTGRSTRSGKPDTAETPKKPQRTRADSQSSLKEDVSGRRSRRGTETSSEDETKSQVSSPKGGARASRKNSTFVEPSSKEVVRKSTVREISRLSTRSASQSDSDSVKSDTTESMKKPSGRQSRVGVKKGVSTDASASESEDASSTSSKVSTPVKSRMSRAVKPETSPSPKGSRLSVRKLSQPMEKYRIMFTGLDEKSLAKFQNIVHTLGGIIEENNPSSCTVLVTDKVRRTIKFLSILAQGKPIVSIKWLEVSSKTNIFKDPFEFLIQDKQSEQNFDFKLSESLTKAHDTPLLSGYSVFVTPSVKPEPSQMKMIIESAGGKFLSKPPAVWNETSFVVSTAEDKSHWPKEKGGKFTPKIVSAEIILRGVLQQKLDFEAHKLK